MAERLDLHEFQTRLAERLKGSADRDVESSRLGFLAGGRHWLIALDQVGEVVTVSKLAKAPWTQPWFIGVAGVRGTIYGCTDLAAYLGVAPAESPEEVQLLLAGARFGAHAAFRIDRALGLRNTGAMTQAVSQELTEPWRLGAYIDAEGTEWQEISLEQLLTEADFLRVAAR
jgi:twitching motility protein PilI